MALTISSVVVILVSTTFLVQNRYYALQLARASTQDVARSTTALVAQELRSAAGGGITVARADSMVVRTAMAVAVVCASRGGSTYVYLDGGESALDTDDVAGFAVHDAATGSWSYYRESWRGGLDGGTRDAADDCADNGADTTGIYDDFLRLRRIPAQYGGQPADGALLMIFRELAFAFRESGLEPGTVGFYRGTPGDTLVEFASGLDTTAAFSYRRSTRPGFTASVSGVTLDSIDAVRVVARARRTPGAGGTEDIVFGWSVDLPLRNAP